MVSHRHVQPTDRPALAPAPTFFIGIDVGKHSHAAGFVSASLLKEHRFEQCPVITFEHSRAGLGKLLARVKEHAASPAQCAVLVENTGHYHRALVEQLMTEGFHVYVVAIRQKRVNGLNKTDKYDALRLANQLYAELSLGLQVAEKSQQVRRFAPPTDAAVQLQGLMRRRYELAQSTTRCKNKLTAIADELFPEFTQVFRDPNALLALEVRSHFPTPAEIARVSLGELSVVKHGAHPSDRKLEKLQELARLSIGVTASARVAALIIEQQQLIETVQMLRAQLDALDEKIEALVRGSREGKILLSFPLVGTIHAGTILSVIGNIRNFPRETDLRKYCGWAPQGFQTGITFDRSNMGKTGSRLLRQTFFLLTMSAIARKDTVWSKLYQRLLPIKCAYDARTETYKGRMRVVGRVAGQMIGVMYTLLKRDANLVDSLEPGAPLPEPDLYDPEIHAGSKANKSQQALTNESDTEKIVRRLSL